MKPIAPCYYGDYLQLDKLLGAQQPVSPQYGEPAHDETLFIVVHQAYELWFKQILHELGSIMSIFSQDQVKDEQLTIVVHRMKRVNKIQALINDQIQIMETMTPQDFLQFRNFLVPASGGQSIQFKLIEASLGLKKHQRLAFDQESFYQRLSTEHQKTLKALEDQPSLFDYVENWLARMPFLEFEDFKFWKLYQSATHEMLDSDADIIKANHYLTEDEKSQQLKELTSTRKNFEALFNEKLFKEASKNRQFRLTHKATLSALFISLYQEEPVFNLPYQFLSQLTELDELISIWRYRHAVMVQRMVGSKIGTGGSSGHEYLKATVEANRIFKDLFDIATFLIPKSALPELPARIKRNLGYFFSDTQKEA